MHSKKEFKGRSFSVPPVHDIMPRDRNMPPLPSHPLAPASQLQTETGVWQGYGTPGKAVSGHCLPEINRQIGDFERTLPEVAVAPRGESLRAHGRDTRRGETRMSAAAGGHPGVDTIELTLCSHAVVAHSGARKDGSSVPSAAASPRYCPASADWPSARPCERGPTC